MRIVPSIDADAVVLKVETSGVGIPTKKAERIFDEILAGPQGTQRLVSSSSSPSCARWPQGEIRQNIGEMDSSGMAVRHQCAKLKLVLQLQPFQKEPKT